MLKKVVATAGVVVVSAFFFLGGVRFRGVGEMAVPAEQQSLNVTIMLLMSGALRHPGVWEYWTEKADEWSAETFGEGTVLLNFAMHNPTRNATELLPDVIGRRVANVKKTKCRWGHTTPCMLKLLRGALAAFPDSAFFIFVSRCVLPLKPFSYIHNELQLNGRSRVNVTSYNWPYAPRHSQWLVLKKSHAEQLVARGDLWTTPSICDWTAVKYPDGKRLGAADDETCPLRALTAVALKGPNFSKKDFAAATQNGAFPRYGGEVPASLWEEINDGAVPRPSVNQYELSSTNVHSKTFVCFHACWRFGHGTTRQPSSWISLYADEFRDIMKMSNVWFARKMEREVRIIEFESPTPEEAAVAERMEKEVMGSVPWKATHQELVDLRRVKTRKRSEGRIFSTTPAGEWVLEELKKGQPYAPAEVIQMERDRCLLG